MEVELRPSPISNYEYHDNYVFRMDVSEEEVKIYLRDDTSNERIVVIRGIYYFEASHVLPGNIVNYVSCTRLSSDLFPVFIDDLNRFSSEYLDMDYVKSVLNSDGGVGVYYLRVVPSYGLSLIAVAREVLEIE